MMRCSLDDERTTHAPLDMVRNVVWRDAITVVE